MRRSLPVAALLALAGCATMRAYEGPKLPASELGRIDGAPALNAGLPIEAIIREIDTTPVGVGYSKVLVTPGKHRVLVDCLVPAEHSTVRFELNLDVGAGDRFVLVPESAPGNRSCGEVRAERR
jgi:hypothetical protein